MRSVLLLLILFFFFAGKQSGFGQVEPLGGMEDEMDYSNPKEYELGGLTVSGVRFLDESVLITLTGLNVGERYRIVGDKISAAIENLWKQGLLADIRVDATKIVGDRIFLNFHLTERPRLSRFAFTGISKNEADKLREKLQLVKGKVITDNLIRTTINQIKDHYIEKGFLFVKVDVST